MARINDFSRAAAHHILIPVLDETVPATGGNLGGLIWVPFHANTDIVVRLELTVEIELKRQTGMSIKQRRGSQSVPEQPGGSIQMRNTCKACSSSSPR